MLTVDFISVCSGSIASKLLNQSATVANTSTADQNHPPKRPLMLSLCATNGTYGSVGLVTAGIV